MGPKLPILEGKEVDGDHGHPQPRPVFGLEYILGTAQKFQQLPTLKVVTREFSTGLSFNEELWVKALISVLGLEDMVCLLLAVLVWIWDFGKM